MKQTIVETSSNHVWLRFIIQHVQETCDYPRQRWNQQPYMKTIVYCLIERMI